MSAMKNIQICVNALRDTLKTVDARPENKGAILRAAAPIFAEFNLPPVRTLGAVNQSAKTAKGEKFNIDQYTVYLAPHSSSGAGNTCPAASAECIAACLNYAGRAAIEAKLTPSERRIMPARVARTVLYFASRPHFSAVLFNELQRAELKAAKAGARFFVRINGTSDISPRAMKVDGVNILDAFPNVSFFDYTKVYGRAALDMPSNYDMCFSWASTARAAEALELLRAGHSVAVPFADMGENGRVKLARAASLPSTFMGFPVIDGDKFDARPLDRSEGGAPAVGGYVVGLRVKRSTPAAERAAIDGGFFVTFERARYLLK